MRYAQVDGDGICISVSDLSGEVISPYMIPISHNEFPAGKRRVGDLWEDVEVDPPPVTYRSIDKVEAMGLVRAVTGMTQVQELAFRDDPNLALFWRIWREDVGSVIWRHHPMTAEILGAIEAAGYLSAAQRQAVLDNWPLA